MAAKKTLGITALVKRNKKKTPAKRGCGRTGRPKIVWSAKEWKVFNMACSVTNSRYAVATMMGINEKTIDAILMREKDTTFLEYINKSFEQTKVKLRGRQFQKAFEGNPTMLIWLGKQHLGQKDKHEVDATVHLSWADLVRQNNMT